MDASLFLSLMAVGTVAAGVVLVTLSRFRL
jgi:hypothetical protein